MRLNGADYFFVHEKHPAIHLLYHNQEKLGIAVAPRDKVNTVRLPVHTHTHTHTHTHLHPLCVILFAKLAFVLIEALLYTPFLHRNGTE